MITRQSNSSSVLAHVIILRESVSIKITKPRKPSIYCCVSDDVFYTPHSFSTTRNATQPLKHQTCEKKTKKITMHIYKKKSKWEEKRTLGEAGQQAEKKKRKALVPLVPHRGQGWSSLVCCINKKSRHMQRIQMIVYSIIPPRHK